MGYVFNKSGNYMLLWGKVSRDAVCHTTQKGRQVAGFSMTYDRRHNEDGQMKSQFMEVSAWGDEALYVGHEDIGVCKGDIVLVAGKLVEDSFYKDGEDRSVKKYKIDADLILDMTSIFQLAQMVVVDGAGGSLPGEHADDDDIPDVSKIEDVYEGTPFDDDDLPL